MTWMMVALFAALVVLTFFRDGRAPVRNLRTAWILVGAAAGVMALSSLILASIDDAFKVQAGLAAVVWALIAGAVFLLGTGNAPAAAAAAPVQHQPQAAAQHRPPPPA